MEGSQSNDDDLVRLVLDSKFYSFFCFLNSSNFMRRKRQEEKSSSLPYSQAPVKTGFISCMYLSRKARNLSCLWACFTRQTDIDQFIEVKVDLMHQSCCVFTINILTF